MNLQWKRGSPGKPGLSPDLLADQRRGLSRGFAQGAERDHAARTQSATRRGIGPPPGFPSCLALLLTRIHEVFARLCPNCGRAIRIVAIVTDART